MVTVVEGVGMKPMMVRLTEEDHAELVRRAERLGLPPASLARSFIKGSLDGGSDLLFESASAPAPEQREPLRTSPGSSSQGRSPNGRRKKKKNR